ncbi:integrator complex subunit 8 [Halyomorpha halys]|uniref:integrator complex subunit 8 n=1 Tax=Halyomorpha halys TaxID=286706 RepID=UPI0006D4F155|nr:integrator complex subunit 8 [Halyomorpha halys]
MDVDLLRPGTVPISPDTSLWFEFLLQPAHLEKHLKNPNADPTPVELIIKFVTLSQSEKPPSTDPLVINNLKPFSKRCLALKILALKVASSLNWDLDFFEKSLPMNVTTTLLKDFLYVVSPAHSDPKVHDELNLDELPSYLLFAIFLYHRWVLRSYVGLSLNGKIKPIEVPVEEVPEPEAEKSSVFLKKMSEQTLTLFAPAPSCFNLPSGNADPEHIWSKGEILRGDQIKIAILVDLSFYLVNKGKYPEARSSLSVCLASGPTCHPHLTSLGIAVGIRPNSYKPSLSQQFHEAIAAKYINIDKVLEKDNKLRQLPITYRQGLELDISSEVANGKLITSRDAVATVRALNSVRAALDSGVQLHGPPLSPTSLVKAVSVVLPLGDDDIKKLEFFLLQLLATSESHTARVLASNFSKLPLLSPEEISSVIEPDYVDTISHVNLEESSETLPKGPSLEIAALERLILSSYDAAEINMALIKLTSLKPTVTWEKLNRNWYIPSTLNSALNTLPTAVKRNYAFILVAKSYELDKIKNFGQAKALLRNVIEETGNDDVYEKLRNQLSSEMLLLDIDQFHSEWPAKHLDWTWLTDRCLDAVNNMRSAIREAACLALLNTGAWGSLSTATPPKSTLTDMYLAIARASLQISQFNSKVSTEAWDKLIPLFLSGGKRKDYKALRGLCGVLEPNALSLVISLLARLHNVLMDQPPLDLYVQLTHLWPGTIKNANQYNVKLIAETLMEVLDHALTYYPYNVSWLKLTGDLHFVNGHYRSALGSYLEAAAVVTEHFSRPLHRNILEDHIIKRMIKSCSQLQCHTQAGILCQLLEEADYTTAFKCLSEVNTSDASDSYHNYIWDINILEYLISLHAKRGEHHRKQALVRIIGLLELNSNNNEEIKREAENIRKSNFLRALASQYL